MAKLELATPYRLGDCGCLLETGDGGRPLFVPCDLHPREHACESCRSHRATVARMVTGVLADLCAGCAHMVDKHGARLYDAYMEDPCETPHKQRPKRPRK